MLCGKNKDLFEFEAEFDKILERFAVRIKNKDLIVVYLGLLEGLKNYYSRKGIETPWLTLAKKNWHENEFLANLDTIEN